MLENILTNSTIVPFKRHCKISFERIWYNYFIANYEDISIIFINYPDIEISPYIKKTNLKLYKQIENYCVQIFHHILNAIPINGLDNIEVGCADGRCSLYLKHHLKLSSMTKIDSSESHIKFYSNHHFVPQLHFRLGNPESLPFHNCSFDALVVNFESRYSYNSLESFFTEAFRVIRPKGSFLIYDTCSKETINTTKELLIKSGFKILDETITKNNLIYLNFENNNRLAKVQPRISLKIFKILNLKRKFTI